MIKSTVQRDIDLKIEKIANIARNLEQMEAKANRYLEEAKKLQVSLEKNFQELERTGITNPVQGPEESSERYTRRITNSEQNNLEVQNYQEMLLRSKGLDRLADQVQLRKVTAF